MDIGRGIAEEHYILLKGKYIHSHERCVATTLCLAAVYLEFELEVRKGSTVILKCKMGNSCRSGPFFNTKLWAQESTPKRKKFPFLYCISGINYSFLQSVLF